MSVGNNTRSVTYEHCRGHQPPTFFVLPVPQPPEGRVGAPALLGVARDLHEPRIGAAPFVSPLVEVRLPLIERARGDRVEFVEHVGTPFSDGREQAVSGGFIRPVRDNRANGETPALLGSNHIQVVAMW